MALFHRTSNSTYTVCLYKIKQLKAKQIELLFLSLNESFRNREMLMKLWAVLDLQSSSTAFVYTELVS